MKFIFSIIFTLSVMAQDAVLFINTNDQPLEIAAAKRGAEKMGKTLIVFPEKDDQNVNLESIAEFSKNLKYESVIISGHDGSGQYSGTKGSINRDEIIQIIKSNDYAKENVDSLMLLGCFTGVRREMNLWKGALPNVKLISGYEGAAPLGHRPAGHSFIEDIMEKTEEIVSQTKSSEVERLLSKQIRNMEQLSAAIYVEARMCSINDNVIGEGNEYYYRPQQHGDEEFVLFRDRKCKEVSDHFFGEKFPIYQQYFDGEKPIPSSIAGTELREIYHYIMKNIDCFEETIEETNSALMLLFFHEFKKNAANYYADFFADIKMTLESYQSKPIRESYNDLLDELKMNQMKVENIINNPIILLNKLNLKKDEIQKKMVDLQLTSAEKEMVRRAFESNSYNPVEIDPARMQLISKYAQFYWDLTKIKGITIDKIKENAKQKLEYIKSNISSAESQLNMNDEELKSTHSYYLERLKSIKFPTKDNIHEFSRKDIVELNHNINGVYLPFIKQKDQSKLYQYVDVISRSFYEMKGIPQTWFEQVAHTTEPEITNQLIVEMIEKEVDVELDIALTSN